MQFFRNLFSQPKDDLDPAMKYLIIGLGNPGSKYQNNRHNIGYLALDHLADKREKEFTGDRYGHTLTITHRGRRLVLLKPGTFMNLSGKAFRYHVKKHGTPLSNVLVVTDDIALPFGKLRMRARGSHGGHNGLRDIIEVMENQEFPRLRVGVGSDFPKGGQADYVLADFPQEESKQLPELLVRIEKFILDFAGIGIDRAMSANNG